MSKQAEFSAKRKGDINEINVCSLLLKDGYEVFKNICCTGPVDLIIMKDNNTTLVDVKSVHQLKTLGSRETIKIYFGCKLTPIQKKLGVILLGVHEGKLYWEEEIKDAI